MIEFLKKVLGQKENITLNKITKRVEEEFLTEKEELNGIVNEFQIVLKEIPEHLAKLEDVDVSQVNADDRLKNAIKGNKPSYIQAVNLLINKIEVPESVHSKTLKEFDKNFQEELNDFNKRTYKNFHIVQQLVGKELAEVAKRIKQMDELSKKLKTKSERLKLAEEIEDKTCWIIDGIQNKEKNIQLRKQKEKELETLQEEKKQLSQELQDINQGSEMKELDDLKLQLTKLGQKVSATENEFLSKISTMQKAMKKFNNINRVKKIEQYLESPIDAITHDSEFEIIKLLEEIRMMINQGKIDIKKDKQQKTTDTIKSISKDYLEDFLKRRQEIREEMIYLEKEIAKNQAKKNQEETRNKIQNHEEKLETKQKEINRIVDINEKEAKEELQNMLSELLKKEVMIEDALD